MPIELRRWWIGRMQKEQEQRQQAEQQPQNKGRPPPPGVIPGMKK